MTGAEMRALRERHNLSRDELATILGVSSSYVAEMEQKRQKPVSGRVETKLSEWGGSDDDAAGRVSGPDDLPDAGGAGRPGEPVDDGSGETLPRKLTGWQKEAAETLAVLIRGQAFNVGTADGQQQIVIPGLAHGVAMFWCPVCAQITARAADPLSVCFVRAYPSLARRLLAPGPQAELIMVLVTQIAIPCTTHHLHRPSHEREQDATLNGSDGAGA